MITTDLHPFRCANPECRSRRDGRGQIVMRGDNRPGWRGEGYCHQCKYYTTAVVTTDGVEYSCRLAKSYAGVIVT